MDRWSRRDCVKALGSGALGAGVAGSGPPAATASTSRGGAQPPGGKGGTLALADFQPRSMLHVPETKVPTPRFPVVDVHTHLTPPGRARIGRLEPFVTPQDALALMERKGLRTLVNLWGGSGPELDAAIRAFDRTAPGRFFTCTEPVYDRLLDPRYPQIQADEIVKAKAAGARGLKIAKGLGLGLRERIKEGSLVKVDDPRFDPMWEAAASTGLPVFIHIADPEAFFLPVDRFNERWDELGHHPDWSFYGKDFPRFQELMAARDRVYARHPKTQFLSLHVGHDAENLAFVAESLDRFPNMTVELGARIGELGRQPRASRKFFDRYQDRILFGTDAIPPPEGESTPQQVFKDELYEIYYRFLETEDEYFDYAPAPVPPQGRWRIYGIGLPDAVLKKVYHQNAERLLGLGA